MPQQRSSNRNELTLSASELRRWERVAGRSLGARLRAGVSVAVLMGAVFSALAVLVAVAQGSTTLHGRHGQTVPLVAVLAAYLVAGPMTGALFGALFRGTRTLIGAYMVGVVAALPTVGAVVWGLAGGPPPVWEVQYWFAAAVMLVTLGGIGGVMVRQLAAA